MSDAFYHQLLVDQYNGVDKEHQHRSLYGHEAVMWESKRDPEMW